MSTSAKQVVVSGAFDDIRSRHLRFLQATAGFGPVNVLLWPDAVVQATTGKPPKFPFAERLYFLNALRYVSRVLPLSDSSIECFHSAIWINEEGLSAELQPFGPGQGWEPHSLKADPLQGFPELAPQPSTPGRKKVVVTGCYDWFHSGHVRFFEEVSAHGDLYVIVGHDANIRLLKGEGHPLLSQEERRYIVSSIRYVTQAVISSGHGWLDADPEIQRLKPAIYAVNEEGDKGDKRGYCEKLGIEYLVLKRAPAPGLQRRSSTDLRGF